MTIGGCTRFLRVGPNPIRKIQQIIATIAVVLFFCAASPNANAIVINSLNDLLGISNDLSGDYVLGGNIDASATASWNGGAGFLPIGTGASPFSGTFDGAGYSISGLTINSSLTEAGFFGYQTGTIQNLILNNLGVNGTAANQHVGGLVGQNGGTITNVSVQGSVTSLGIESYVGGLVGTNNGAVRSSNSSAVVQGNSPTSIGVNCCTDHGVGGLVGNNNNNGAVTLSSATATVEGLGGFNATGGLVGTNRGNISKSYSTATVLGAHDYTAGLVGLNRSGNIQQSFAQGSVTSTTSRNASGLIGLADLGGAIDQTFATGPLNGVGGGGLIGAIGFGGVSVSNSYWDKDSTGLTTSPAGIGLSTSQLQSGSLPAGFNSNDWTATAGQYPYLTQLGVPSKNTGLKPPPAGSLAPGSNTLLGDASTFDRTKPTIVLTHGWQPLSTYTENLADTEFGLEMYTKVKSIVGNNVNVIFFEWSDAFVPAQTALTIPAATAASVGNELGLLLKLRFGSSYSQPIHFIGHSYGSLVNATAAKELTKFGITVQHMTILDAPTRFAGFAGAGPVPINYYTDLVKDTNIIYVDNYYGTGNTSFGEKIPGTATNGGTLYQTGQYQFGHTGVWKEYAKTIENPNSSSGGFYYSAALGSAGGFVNRPGSQQLSPILFQVQNPNLSNPLLQHASFNTAGSTPSISISTGSDGYAVFSVDIGPDVKSLMYDLLFSNIGDGDWLEVLFDDLVVQSVLGLHVPDGVHTFFVDLSQFAGSSVNLSFALRSSGPVPASVQISNVGFLVPVSEPSSIAILGIGLAGLAWLRRRRRAA